MWCFLSFLPLLFGLDDAAAVLLIGSLIGVVADVATGLYNNSENKNENAINRNWQESMMDKQNEYNTPANQMQRLQEAGINPATIGMASGTVQGGNLSAGVGSSPTLPVSNLGSISGSLSQIMNAFKSGAEGNDIKSTREARINQILQHNAEMKANAELIGAKKSEQDIINNYADARELYAREGQKADIEVTYQQAAMFKQNARKFQYEVEHILPEELKLKVQQGKLNVLDMDKVVAEIADLKASAHLKSEQSKTEGTKQELNMAQTGLVEDQQIQTQEQTKLTEEEIAYYADLQEKYLEYYQSMIDKNSADTGLTKEETYWYQFKLLSDAASHGIYDWANRNSEYHRIRDNAKARSIQRHGVTNSPIQKFY